MRKKQNKLMIYLLLIIVALAAYFWFQHSKTSAQSHATCDNSQSTSTEAKIEKPDRIQSVEITNGSTFGALMATSGVEYASAMEIYAAAKNVYDLVKIRQGRSIDLIHDKDTDEFKELRYKIDTENELFISKNNMTASSSDPISSTSPETAGANVSWKAEIKPIAYEVKIKESSGTVNSSMYQAALDNGIDVRAIIDLADAFQWSIDFAMDPRVGDTFKFIYEERYLNGQYVMPGQILAAKYINNGTEYDVYYFEEDKDNIGFFDEKGNSVQKMFLKAPVEFKYISSGYTTGSRIVMEFGLTGAHLAIDYAATYGTPIRSVGDGTVTFAGWKTGYGNYTMIRHNGTYSTNYGHQSKFLVKVGQKVKQGQTIGLVGSTGYSTGPHVHFEMVKNGKKINPLTEVLPPGKPIKAENKDRFFDAIKGYQDKLK
jgi:murein DD-endopeptidase MepM/ murein hydrolase activator NlpD